MCKREFEILMCTSCDFCHEINFVGDIVYFCGILGIVLKKDSSRPVMPDECEIKKITIEEEE